MVRVSVAVALIATILYVFLFSPVFKIKNIEFNAKSCLSDQKQLEKYQVLGKNILIFKSGKLAQKLKNDFPCIDQIKITKALSTKLKIEITVQNLVAKIEGSNLAVTKDGTVNQSTQTNLPTIFLPSETFLPSVALAKDGGKEGQKISDPTALFALQVVSQLQKSDFTPQNIRIVEGDDVAVYDTTGIIALFSSSKDAVFQVDSLQAILAKDKIDQAKIAKIDLRLEKPVIVYKQ